MMVKALVIGGGIAGTATAMALQRVGVDAVVYEAYDRTADGVGSFLGVAPSGMDALRTLGLYETTRAAGFDIGAIALFSGSGRKLVELSIGMPNGTVPQVVRRADLYVALRDEAVRRGVVVRGPGQFQGHEPGRVRRVDAAAVARKADRVVQRRPRAGGRTENAVSATHLHKESEVRGYKLVFDRLRSEALSPHDSVVLVERLAAEL